jgi:hypothetical protein
MAGAVDDGSQYSNGVAAIFVFNLIVGVGVLNLPLGFQSAGLVSNINYQLIMQRKINEDFPNGNRGSELKFV